MSHSRFTSACLAALAAMAVASAALAHPSFENEQPASSTISLRDVDLHTQAGVKEAARRIDAAASFVCALDPTFDFSSCRNDAINRALATLQAQPVSGALGAHDHTLRASSSAATSRTSSR